MAVERSGIELSENIDLGYIAIEAIAYGNINQPVVRTQRNSRLRSLLGQRIETSPSTTSKYNPQYTLKQHPTQKTTLQNQSKTTMQHTILQ